MFDVQARWRLPDHESCPVSISRLREAAALAGAAAGWPESVAATQERRAPGCLAQGLARRPVNARNSFPSGSASTCQRTSPPGSRSTVARAWTSAATPGTVTSQWMRFFTVFGSGKDSCFKVPISPGRTCDHDCERHRYQAGNHGDRAGCRLFAGSDSYSHIYTLARENGQAIVSAALLPLAGDGLIAAASSAMLVASRQGRDVPVLARVMLLAGIGATIAANVGYGLHAGITGALLSVWPVAAYVGCMELLTWMRRNTGMHPAAQPASADAAADAPDELARRRHSTGGLLDAAGRAFPAAGADNVPSLREIQRALRIGQGKAQQVQAHLAGRPADAI